MKILILGSGQSFHATRWANALSEKGLEVGFVTVHKIIRHLNDDISVFELSNNRGLGYILDVFKLKKVLATFKPDILHIHFSTGYGLLGKLSGYPTRIVSVYGTDIYDFPNKSIFHKKLLEFNLNGAKQILSTSESMADEFLKHYKNKFNRPIVTPFGVDIKKFKPLDKDKKDLSVIKIGLVKKLEKKYGISTLIKSFALLVKELPKYKFSLEIGGGGSQLEYLQQLSKELDIEKLVTFHGWMDNSKVPDFFNNLDICVIPSESESESFGVAAVEAQACGIPVIVSNVGGLPEVVKENVTGLVFPVENVKILVETMKKLSVDKELRITLGKGGRKRVKELYDWDKNVDFMIKIYGETI